MKLATKKNTFHTNGIVKKIDYKVANSTELMDILSDLYSDPLLAAVREISANAWDAHRKVNNPRPFDVQIPSTSDPTFRVRDYGPGLSLEQFENLYTVYGRSDKNNSNDDIGGFGLGSKSPFAYIKHAKIDNWLCISYYNGQKIIGVNALDRRGRSSFNILSVEPTNEPNGLEVSFQVRNNDIKDCKDKATQVYRYFNSIPRFICDSHLAQDIIRCQKADDSKFGFQGDDWKIAKSSSWGNRVHSRIIMGSMQYPIDYSHFDGTVKKLIDHGLELRCEIGDVDISPSRDSLKYTQHTIELIEEKVQEAIRVIRKKIEDQIQDCDYKWDARLKAIDLKTGDNRAIFHLVANKVFYNGEEISTESTIWQSTPDCDLSHFVRFVRSSRGNNSISTSHGDSIHVRDNTRFVIHDDKKGKGHAQVRRYISDNNNQTLYLFDCDSGDKAFAKKYIVNTLGVNPKDILYTSLFPRPAAVTNSNGKVVKRADNILQCQRATANRYSNSMKSYWTATEVDINDGTYYYVILNKDYSVRDSRNYNSISYLSQIATSTGLSERIIGLTERRYEKIKNLANWKKFDNCAKDYLDKWHAIEDNVKSIEAARGENFNNRFKALRPFISHTTVMAKFLDNFKKLTKNDENRSIERLIECYEKWSGQTYIRPESNIKLDTDKVMRTYPLLEVIDDSLIETTRWNNPEEKNVKLVANYINSIG